MKKRLVINPAIICFSFLVSIASHSQTVQKQLSDYVKKSKKQRTTGLILAGGEVTLIAVGSVAMQQSNSKGENEVPIIPGGLIMTTASIPFFIVSGRNRHKARVFYET